MNFLVLRWPLLMAAVLGAGRCALFGPTPRATTWTAVCGLLWFWLSRRKVRSLDRESLGVPARR